MQLLRGSTREAKDVRWVAELALSTSDLTRCRPVPVEFPIGLGLISLAWVLVLKRGGTPSNREIGLQEPVEETFSQFPNHSPTLSLHAYSLHPAVTVSSKQK